MICRLYTNAIFHCDCNTDNWIVLSLISLLIVGSIEKNNWSKEMPRGYLITVTHSFNTRPRATAHSYMLLLYFPIAFYFTVLLFFL